MNATTPFSLRIFVIDGDTDGLRVVDRTNWNGKNKYGYPPDLQDEAVKTVLKQAELLCAGFGVG